MANKKLTAAQKSVLNRLLSGGKICYRDVIRTGGNGATTKFLEISGLAEAGESQGHKLWKITQAGKDALASGFVKTYDTVGEK